MNGLIAEEDQVTTAETAYEAYRAALGLPGSFFSLTSNERDAWEDVVEAIREAVLEDCGPACREERNG